MKHLKIQHLFSNPKNTPAVTITKKIRIFEIQNPKKCSADPNLTPSDFLSSVANARRHPCHIHIFLAFDI